MVNEKDVMRKLKYFAGIAAALMLWGCSEDKFVPDQYSVSYTHLTLPTTPYV